MRTDGMTSNGIDFESLTGGGRKGILAGAGDGTAPDGLFADDRREQIACDVQEEIMRARLEAQRRIGQDLHDTLGQELAAITFLAKALRKEMEKANPEAAERARNLERLAQKALRSSQRIAKGLVPVDVSAAGLPDALQRMCRDTSGIYDIVCRCTIGPPGVIHDDTVATHLYHVAKESIRNAIRHGRAKEISLQLCTGERGSLTVKDNGAWIPRASGDGGGMGLRIMSYRASAIQGELTVDNTSGGDTTVRLTFRNAEPKTDV